MARELAVAERAFGLGDLVLVVREDQVDAAAVDVERLAQIAVRHRRALDVPAGPPGAPRALPRRLARLGALPEREVERAALLLADLDARARLQVVDALAPRACRSSAKPRHGEVDVAAGGVGEALVDQALMISMISAMCSVARGSTSAGATPSARMSAFIVARVLARHLGGGALLGLRLGG